MKNFVKVQDRNDNGLNLKEPFPKISYAKTEEWIFMVLKYQLIKDNTFDAKLNPTED